MDMQILTIDVPPEVIDAVRLPRDEIEEEFRKELAVALYQRGVLPLSKARLLAQMTRWAFEDVLGQRKIVRHYTQSDLDEDIRYAHGRQ